MTFAHIMQASNLSQRYTDLQNVLEAVQAAGKLSLSEAGNLCVRLGQLKCAIEELNTSSTQATKSTGPPQNTQEIEDIKVQLVSRNIALDTAQRKLKVANEKLAKLQASVPEKSQPIINPKVV